MPRTRTAFDLADDDTPCACCGDDATHTHGDGAYCRPCWKAVADPRRGGPGGVTGTANTADAKRVRTDPCLNEAAAHRAQRERANRQQGRTSGGRRF